MIPLFNIEDIPTGIIYSTEKSSEKSDLTTGVVDDPAVEMKYMAYMQWHYSNIAPIAWEAQNFKINFSQSDIEIMAHEFSMLFPGREVNNEIILNEVLAGKYIHDVIGVSITDKENENAYEEIVQKYVKESAPAMSDIANIVENRAFAALPVIQGEISRINDKNEKLKSKSNKEVEKWTLDQLRLPYKNDYCIAEHPDSSNCILNAGYFNNLLRYQEYNTSVPLDTARKMAITTMLFDKYLMTQAKKSGYDTTGEAIEGAYDWLKWSAQRERFKNLGFPVTDEHILRGIYDEYYTLLFGGGKKKIWCSLAGASDSVFIDSIYMRYADTTVTESDKERSKTSKSIVSTENVWSKSSTDMLPEVFNSVMDTLRIGTVSDRINTSFGFFLLRIDSIGNDNTIPYEVAKEKLSLIATKRKWENLDSLIAEKSFQIYASGKKSVYKVKDTLSLLMYLQAGYKPDSLWGNGKNRNQNKPDTSGLTAKCIKLSSLQLPGDLLECLYKKYEMSKKQEKKLGPVLSKYGVCYFIITNIKPGRKVIPYSLVKKKITDSLIVASVDSGVCALYEKPDSLLREVSIARAYNKIFFEPSEDDMKDNDKKKNKYNENEDYYDVKLSEIQSWVEKIRIHVN